MHAITVRHSFLVFLILCGGAVGATLPGVLSGGDAFVPVSSPLPLPGSPFQPNTPARAADVNDKFASLQSSVETIVTGINTTVISKLNDFPGALIRDGSVTSAELATSSILLDDLADNSVDSTAIVDGQVQAVDLGIDSVDGDKILNGSVQSEDLAPELQFR